MHSTRSHTPLSRHRGDVITETNERIQKALLTDPTETLTSYDLVKKFGEEKHKEKAADDDESVDFLDCLCLESAGFVDDIMGLNADKDEEEKDAKEDSVVELSPEQQDPNFKRAPKLDPQFIPAPAGPPAALTAKSWSNLIDAGAARKRDRRKVRKQGRGRQRLFASTEEEKEDDSLPWTTVHDDSPSLPMHSNSDKTDEQSDRALVLYPNSDVRPPTPSSEIIPAPRIFVPLSTKSYEQEYVELFPFNETPAKPRVYTSYEEEYATLFSPDAMPYDESVSEIIRTPELVVRLGVVSKSSSDSK